MVGAVVGVGRGNSLSGCSRSCVVHGCGELFAVTEVLEMLFCSFLIYNMGFEIGQTRVRVPVILAHLL